MSRVFKSNNENLDLLFTTSHKYKFAWFRMPKVASRSILIYMAYELQKKDSASFKPNEFMIWGSNIKKINIEDKNQVIDGRRMRKFKCPNDFFLFTFVRNPWDRIASCYRNKIFNRFWWKCDVGNLSNLKINGIGIHKSERSEPVTFKEFLLYLNENKDSLHKNEHWAPQTSLVDMDQLDFVGKLETLDKDWKYVCEKIGIEYKTIGNLNSTKLEDEYSYREFYEEIEWIPSKEKQFCIDLVNEIYKEEIEKFNYKY